MPWDTIDHIGPTTPEDVGRPDAVGRVERLLYDCVGRFEGFELGTRDDTFFVVARGRSIERLALRACRCGLTVAVWYGAPDARRAEHVAITRC